MVYYVEVCKACRVVNRIPSGWRVCWMRCIIYNMCMVYIKCDAVVREINR